MTYPPRTSTDGPHDMPPRLQAELHSDGLLTDPDYFFDGDRVTLNAPKLRLYVAEHGEPWH